MSGTFDSHFTEDTNSSTYKFVLSSLTPIRPRSELIDALAAAMTIYKSDPQVTADLLAVVGWTTAIADLRAGGPSFRRGDFSEMLAAECAEHIDGMKVPVRKLRYQIDPNQTLPSSDVVAFSMNEEGEIEDIEFIESKYRTNPSIDIATDAHEQLAKDRESGFATTINFLAHRLYELDSTMYNSFLSYLRERGSKDGFHTIVLTFDQDNWRDEIAEDLDDLPGHLPELWLRIFALERASELVDDVYSRLLWDVVDDDD